MYTIQEAKTNGDSITVETCPHYLAFSAEEIPDGDTRFKCAPPIRDAANKEKLWEALMVLRFSRPLASPWFLFIFVTDLTLDSNASSRMDTLIC